MSVLHHFHYATHFTLRGISLAVMLDSLVRVSRRGDEVRYKATTNSSDVREFPEQSFVNKTFLAAQGGFHLLDGSFLRRSENR